MAKQRGSDEQLTATMEYILKPLRQINESHNEITCHRILYIYVIQSSMHVKEEKWWVPAGQFIPTAQKRKHRTFAWEVHWLLWRMYVFVIDGSQKGWEDEEEDVGKHWMA
jgi:hypothetical protein